jgi:serine/threonine protein kinase
VGAVVGEGGFCQVRLAVHHLSRRRVAVKVIDKTKLSDAAEARRMQVRARGMPAIEPGVKKVVLQLVAAVSGRHPCAHCVLWAQVTPQHHDYWGVECRQSHGHHEAALARYPHLCLCLHCCMCVFRCSVRSVC